MEIKPFCYAPWVALNVRGPRLFNEPKKLLYAPCCAWQEDFVEDLSEFADFKKIMINHDYSFINKSCAECIEQEQAKGTSERLRFAQKVDKNWFTLDKINWIDIRPSNLCNLKCIICSPRNSSMIAKEENEIYHDATLDDLKKLDLSNVKQFKVLGGEPTIQAKALDFIDYMIETYDVSKMDIQISSNGTNVNDNLLNKFLPFKICYYNLSIDGTDSTFEYVRKNANWSSIKENIDVLKTVRDKNENFYLKIQCTIGAVCLLTIDKWLEEFIDLDVESDFFLAQGRKHSIAAIPFYYRNKIKDYLETVQHTYAVEIKSMIDGVEYDEKSHRAFINNIRNKDKIRNTDISVLHPYLKEIFNGS